MAKGEKIKAFLKKRGRDIASATLDVLPIPNILKFIPDRNNDGKRDIKDIKWFEMATGVAIMLGLVKLEVVSFEQLLVFVKMIIEGIVG